MGARVINLATLMSLLVLGETPCGESVDTKGGNPHERIST